MSGRTRAEAARALGRLSQALAEALEADDLDTAELLVEERGRLLDQGPSATWTTGPEDATAMAEAEAAVIVAERRCQVALARSRGTTRGELGELVHGARAMRAYLPAESLAPGYVDRHD